MKICIIGGSGFVGTHLIRKIKKNHEVIVIDKRVNPEFVSSTIQLDIRDPEFSSVDLSGVDLIIHLAAEHRDDITPVSLYYDVNVKGTKNILDVMDKNDISNIIFTSTVAIYGLNKSNPDESFPAEPFNDYGKSKWKAEEVLYGWLKESPANRKLSIVRPSVIFGEENRGNVYNLLKQVVSGRFLMIGNGENKKSMAYVGNVVSFIEHLIEEKSTCEVYNYTDTPDLSTNQLIEIIKKSLNIKIPPFRIPYYFGLFGGFVFDVIARFTRRKLPISAIRVRKFCADTQINASKAHESGFTAPFSIHDGLGRTIKYEFDN